MTEDLRQPEETEEREVVGADEGREAAEGSRSRVEGEISKETPRQARNRNLTVITSVVIAALVAIVALAWWSRSKSSTGVATKTETAAVEEKQADEHGGETGGEVELSPEAITAAGIQIEGVTQRPAVGLLRVTGTVETNQQQTQAANDLFFYCNLV